jgi:RNA polymerase sigma-70 factor (ECF subfamily)
MSAGTCSPARQISDEELVKNVAAGDREAFDQLYTRYIGRVFRFVEKRLRNRADVEETTQEVFINVFSSLASFREEAPFAAWVLGVARRTIASRFKKKEHPTVPLDLEGGGDGDFQSESDSACFANEPSPLEYYELRERLQRLETAAERHLSPEQQQLFRLHHLEHRAIADIATTLDKSEDAVKSNLYRVRKVLLAR